MGKRELQHCIGGTLGKDRITAQIKDMIGFRPLPEAVSPFLPGNGKIIGKHPLDGAVFQGRRRYDHMIQVHVLLRMPLADQADMPRRVRIHGQMVPLLQKEHSLVLLHHFEGDLGSVMEEGPGEPAPDQELCRLHLLEAGLLPQLQTNHTGAVYTEDIVMSQ